MKYLITNINYKFENYAIMRNRFIEILNEIFSYENYELTN